MNPKPVSYLQTDSRWAGVPYAAAGESATIGGSGCGPTAMAMVLATWADPAVTPKSECAWALKNGYKCKGHGTYYAYFPPAANRFGLVCRQLNYASIEGNGNSSYHARVRQALQAGDLVIACMGPGNWTRSGHFVLLWDVDEARDIAYVNDPASTLERRTRGSWKLFKTQVKYYFHIKKPAKTPEKEDAMKDDEIRKLIQETVGKTVRELLPAMLREAVQDGIIQAKAETAMAAEPAWSAAEGGWTAACQAGVFDGSRPRSEITRAETAAVLYRLGLLSKPPAGGAESLPDREKLEEMGME